MKTFREILWWDERFSVISDIKKHILTGISKSYHIFLKNHATDWPPQHTFAAVTTYSL